MQSGDTRVKPRGIFSFEPKLYSIRSTAGRTIFFSSNFGGNAVGCVTGNARDVWHPIFGYQNFVVLIRRKWAVLRFLRILERNEKRRLDYFHSSIVQELLFVAMVTKPTLQQPHF